MGGLTLINPNLDGYKKVHSIVEPPSPPRTPSRRLGVIYDSQPAGIHKKTTTNRWMLLLS
jgi:hypothetical protein